ncbi:MAG: DUF2325 domain-containing protein [Deltaproteobacteria bacterium]|nr:DUF2325 domain-containing protein [Deltaproteobacteria bacterium]
MEKGGVAKPQITQREMGLNLFENHSTPQRPPTLRFWEIDPFFKCPAVGICLTFSEQKQVLKKAGISSKRKSSFEIHEILVGSSETENRVSRQVDRLLNRKFNGETASLKDMNEKVFMGHWASCFYAGNFAGAFWAAAIRSDLSGKSRGEIFGAVHMSMHGNVEESARFKQQLMFHREEATKMAVKSRDASRARKTLQKENVKLQKSIDVLRTRLAGSEKETARLARALSELKSVRATLDLEGENECLTADLEHLSEKMEQRDTLLADLEAQNRRLSGALAEQREAGASLQGEAERLIKEAFRINRCDETCPSYDLCQRRVLMVGGLTKMKSLYRQVIEGSNGIFEYHDGYMQKGAKDFESRLKRADMVLCPVTCNSHAACALVKSLGKKHKKPVRLLASSSLSAIAQAVSGKGGVYVSDN